MNMINVCFCYFKHKTWYIFVYRWWCDVWRWHCSIITFRSHVLSRYYSTLTKWGHVARRNILAKCWPKFNWSYNIYTHLEKVLSVQRIIRSPAHTNNSWLIKVPYGLVSCFCLKSQCASWFLCFSWETLAVMFRLLDNTWDPVQGRPFTNRE